MRVIVKKWGNSASVRIPTAIMEAAHLELDAAVDISEENGRIVIIPLRDPEYDLDDLLAKITDQNMHEASDFGALEGMEAI